jgi:hypothetical protein
MPRAERSRRATRGAGEGAATDGAVTVDGSPGAPGAEHNGGREENNGD